LIIIRLLLQSSRSYELLIDSYSTIEDHIQHLLEKDHIHQNSIATLNLLCCKYMLYTHGLEQEDTKENFTNYLNNLFRVYDNYADI